MKKSVKECLQEWKVPRHYVGYQYLLDAADLYAQGVPVGWPMLFQIGEKRGRAMFRVRKGLYTVVKYVRATPFGLAWQAAKGHPFRWGNFCFTCWSRRGRETRWGKGRPTRRGSPMGGKRTARGKRRFPPGCSLSL
ncbi:MAG: hypothetical protein ACLSCQ_11550 [Evtepia gabavorous]